MKKRGIIWDSLIPWIIGMVILVLSLIFIWALKGGGDSAIDYVKDIFRFGR